MTDKMENISRSALYRESASSLEDQYISKGYTYDADKKVWVAPKPTAPRPLSVKPEKPANGDFWIDTSTGATYVYYEDYESQSWIQVGGSASVS